MNLRSFPYRAKLWLVNRIVYWAGEIGGWALVRRLDLMGYPVALGTRELVRREIDAIGPRVAAAVITSRGISA